jgi:hypothetical protein
MQFNNIHPIVRFIIAGVMFVAFFFAMVEWSWLDPVIQFSKILTYVITAIWAMMIGAVCYALIPTKKIVDLSITSIKSKGKKDRVVGYWLWLGCFVVLFCGALAWYINEM